MLLIPNRDLHQEAVRMLAEMQQAVNAAPNYALQVSAAKAAWDGKASTKRKATAFRIVRETLGQMCVGPIRCAYCEDSMADEVEHIHPKNLFPDRVFLWSNYAFACGPCNGPKRNRYGFVENSSVTEFVRRRQDPIIPPPNGQAGLIDPRHEDPLAFLELDLGGETPDGQILREHLSYCHVKSQIPLNIRAPHLRLSYWA